MNSRELIKKELSSHPRITDTCKSFLCLFWREKRRWTGLPKPFTLRVWVLLRNGVDGGDQDVACEARVMNTLAAIVFKQQPLTFLLTNG
jgi:hypothetical protein